MITQAHKDTAQWVLKRAKSLGCQASRVMVYAGSDTELEVRGEQLDTLQQATEQQLLFHLFVDGRYGSFSTNRMDRVSLEPFLQNAVASVRHLEEDRARHLPDPSLYAASNLPDLDLTDPDYEALTMQERLSFAQAAASEVYGTDARVLSVQANWNDSISSRFLIDSQGFEGLSSVSFHALSVAVTVKGAGDARPKDYDFDQALYRMDVRKEGIGKKALERALAKIGQRKMASGRFPILVDNRVAAQLFSPILSALFGSALHQNNSFLRDSLHTSVFSEKLTVRDVPHTPRCFGSRFFDLEGVATQARFVVDKGVLSTYFIDTYASEKLERPVSISSPSRLVFEPGSQSFEALLSSLSHGIWVTGFNGGNTNSTSGDFSYGIEGFRIEQGKVVQALSEMNITGNMRSLWKNLVALGNDPRQNSAHQLPSLLFDDVVCSGL